MKIYNFYVVPVCIQSMEKYCKEQGSTEAETDTQKFSVKNLI